MHSALESRGLLTTSDQGARGSFHTPAVGQSEQGHRSQRPQVPHSAAPSALAGFRRGWKRGVLESPQFQVIQGPCLLSFPSRSLSLGFCMLALDRGLMRWLGMSQARKAEGAAEAADTIKVCTLLGPALWIKQGPTGQPLSRLFAVSKLTPLPQTGQCSGSCPSSS